MVPIVSLLVILGASLIVTRVASVALEHTGLSRDAARFQARSAFTGVGFTTTEAESVVDHPVRRRVVAWLMLVGNAGILSAMAAVLLSAIDLRSSQGLGILVALLVGGLGLLWAIGSSRFIDHHMCRAIAWALRRTTSLDTSDAVRLLHLREDYGVSRFAVEAGDWLVGQTLQNARLGDEGILVLGIECPGRTFVGTPPADIEIRTGDELVVYGRAARIAELGARCEGAQGADSHAVAVRERVERLREERRRAAR